MQASAAVITILVRNSIQVNSAQVAMAKAWEAVFIDTVLHWRDQHPNISVAFVAEVRLLLSFCVNLKCLFLV